MKDAFFIEDVSETQKDIGVAILLSEDFCRLWMKLVSMKEPLFLILHPPLCRP